jgi:hypothetical protein
MKVLDCYNEKKLKYKDYILLFKLGNFYEAFGEDSYLLNNLFNYKVREFSGSTRAGFPLVAYNKVINKLNAFKINYLIIEDNNVILKKRFNKNAYYDFISKGLELDVRIKLIYEKLSLLKNDKKIITILNEIEDIL